ncbi:hypothetical protein CHS0354_031065 [Potamilus streckersoni]|uniref:Nucleolar protein 9 n=1 Tax=Potamilus streckersoni TaxID=2493646 RepID=A0AAE0TE79_9BIVA|nr:hypothetical protein CHS0354_031065 [Potamilus streckersoni]
MSRKRGSFKGQDRGKQSRVDDHTINYYKRVSETLKEGFPSDEEKDLFLNNVVSQLAEEATHVCHHPGTSMIIEDLIHICQLHHVLSLFSALKTDWYSVGSDRFASHVLQALVCTVPKFVSKCAFHFKVSHSDGNNEEDVVEKTKGDITISEEENNLIGHFLDLCGFVKEQLSTCLDHVYFSHIMRAVLQVLGGTCVSEKVLRSRLSRTRKKEDDGSEARFDDFEVPPAFKKMFKRISKNIFHIENFSVHLSNPSSSPVIQTVLLISKKLDKDLCERYLRKTIKKSGLLTLQIDPVAAADSQKLPPIVKDNVGSFLVEQIISLANGSLFGEIYKEIFKGRLIQFASHPSANYVLQRLLTSCSDKQWFEEIFEELSLYMEDILAVNHFGVILVLAEACLRLGCKQEKFRNLLMQAFHCYEPEERRSKIVPLLASCSTYEVFYHIEDKESQEAKGEKAKENLVPLLTEINYHGSLVLQHLLRFGNPKLVTASLLELKPVELQTMACDPCGSHVIDTYFQSPTIGEKGRETLINRMKGLFVHLACSKSGSRTLENIWKAASIQQKSIISEDLARQEVKLRSDKLGHYIHHNFAINHYIHRRNDWLKIQGTDAKKRKLFQDILDPSDKLSKKQRKEKKFENKGKEESLLLKDDQITTIQLPGSKSKAEVKTSENSERNSKSSKSGGKFRVKEKK